MAGEAHMHDPFENLTCPVCHGTSFASETSGWFFFSKMVCVCTRCKTQLQILENPAPARVKIERVGAAYSNTAALLQGVSLSPEECGSDDLPVHSDEELAGFAKGEIPTSFYDEETPQANGKRLLRTGEMSVLLLTNVYAFDDRVQRSLKTSRRSIQSLVGEWRRLSPLLEPRWSNVTETLDRGTLWITTERYCFLGERRKIEEPLVKIRSVLLYRDGMAIARINNPKTEYYKGSYHWPFVSAILRGLIHNAGKE